MDKNNTGDRNIEICQKFKSKYVKLFKYVMGTYGVLYILDIGIL